MTDSLGALRQQGLMLHGKTVNDKSLLSVISIRPCRAVYHIRAAYMCHCAQSHSARLVCIHYAACTVQILHVLCVHIALCAFWAAKRLRCSVGVGP